MAKNRKKSARLREMAISFICRVLARLWRLPLLISRQPLTIAPNARILIIKPCCLGDVVYTTPVIAALRSAYPQAYLAYTVSQWSRSIIESNLHLNQIIDTGVNGSNFSLKEYFNLAKRLRRERFEVAIVLDRSPLLAFLPFLAGIRVRAGIDSRGRGFALNIRAKLERSDPVKHEAELYLSVLQAINLTPKNPRTEFFPPPLIIQSMQEKAVQKNLVLSDKLAIIHPGGGTNPDTKVLSKRWSPENFAEIAKRLNLEGWQVAVIGAKADLPLADIVCASSPSSHEERQIYNLAGMFDIAESAALMQYAKLYIGNDTGLTQLAAAFDCTVIAIFGPSHPVAYRPYSPKGFAVAPPGAELSPHLPLEEYQNLAAEQGGIEAVTVDQVWKTIRETIV